MWIDSWFSLFGPERDALSARLCCSLISHIFHDCVGYCTANHMCYPLSCALAMSYFFLFFCKLCPWSSVLFIRMNLIWSYQLHYQALCVFCYLFCVYFAQPLNPHWLIEFWLVVQHQQWDRNFSSCAHWSWACVFFFSFLFKSPWLSL